MKPRPPRMVPTGEEFAIECDLVLIAAGFTGCQPMWPKRLALT